MACPESGQAISRSTEDQAMVSRLVPRTLNRSSPYWNELVTPLIRRTLKYVAKTSPARRLA